MKRQKHYTSEQMILDDIAVAYRKIENLKKAVAVLDVQIRDMKLRGSTFDTSSSIRGLTYDRDVLNRKIERQENLRLKRLKNTLAAFRSMLLPGMEPDSSVVLQKHL